MKSFQWLDLVLVIVAGGFAAEAVAYYHPQMGRFTNRDPIQYAANEMNLYNYVKNNPAIFTDPKGEQATLGSQGGASTLPVTQQEIDDCWTCFKNRIGWIYDDGDLMRESRCRCLTWIQKEQKRGDKWLATLPDCPCSIGIPAQNPDPRIWDPPKPASPYFHPGAANCIRSSTATKGGHGQQCCYDSLGKLITGGLGAGSPDYSHSWPPTGEHFFDDVRPWENCRRGGMLWDYFEYRPANNGNKCAANVI